MQCACAILSYVACPSLQYFPTLSHKRYDFRKKKLLNTKCVILTFSTTPYSLTPRCRVLPEQLTGLELVKKFPAVHGTRRFITALTSVRHLPLSGASPIQSTYPHSTSWRSTLILSTHLRLRLPNGLFPSGFPTKTLYTPLSSPIRATCPAHVILLDFIAHTILGEGYKHIFRICNTHCFSTATMVARTRLNVALHAR